MCNCIFMWLTCKFKLKRDQFNGGIAPCSITGCSGGITGCPGGTSYDPVLSGYAWGITGDGCGG